MNDLITCSVSVLLLSLSAAVLAPLASTHHAVECLHHLSRLASLLSHASEHLLNRSLSLGSLDGILNCVEDVTLSAHLLTVVDARLDVAEHVCEAKVSETFGWSFILIITV